MPALYYQEADREGELSIESNVNTAQAGIYYADYVVSGTMSSGKSRLVVVVR